MKFAHETVQTIHNPKERFLQHCADLRQRNAQNGSVRRRTSSVSDAENAKIPTADSTRLVFKVTPLKNVQSDFQYV